MKHLLRSLRCVLFALPSSFLIIVLFALCPLARAQQAGSSTQADTSTPIGRWHVNALGQRMTWRFTLQNGVYAGVRLDDQGAVAEQFDHVTWSADARSLEFRRNTGGVWQWYRVRIVEGVLVGRYTATAQTATRPTDPYAYRWRVTGWNQEYLVPALAPRVFDVELSLNGQTNGRARLRIDRSSKSPSGFEGRLKFYAHRETCREEFEEDFNLEVWNGTNLRFKSRNITYDATINGRFLNGQLLGMPVPYQWRGTQAEVLGHGFATKAPHERVRWQTRVRRQLEHLAMAGNPAPLKQEMTVLRSNLAPLPGTPAANRDDNPNANPPTYRISEFTFRYSIGHGFGGAPIERTSHGYLAKPTAPPRGATRGMGKYPLVIALNGHGGSAYQTLQPDTVFWYGDAFARQGYMVLALDISHRPLSDKIYVPNPIGSALGYNPLYLGGDDIANGNDLRPSIKPAVPPSVSNPELYTDWEEDGERAWDVMRALDYALTRPDVDPTRVVIVGLSMGAEVAAYVGALDPRVSVSVISGFSPDLSTLKYLGSHGCWNWHYSEMREYFDFSDIFALMAPRGLMIQTGKLDPLFSCSWALYAGDKQIARRVRAAYGSNEAQFIHYLHSDQHAFRAGDLAHNQAERWVRVPQRIAPHVLGDSTWQTDDATIAPQQWNVFRYVGNWLGLRFLR